MSNVLGVYFTTAKKATKCDNDVTMFKKKKQKEMKGEQMLWAWKPLSDNNSGEKKNLAWILPNWTASQKQLQNNFCVKWLSYYVKIIELCSALKIKLLNNATLYKTISIRKCEWYDKFVLL